MAITHKYTLLCDEIRQENNGKFLILGLYTPDIAVPAIPFALPFLSFFTYLETDAPGTWDITFRLTHGTSLLAGGSGKMVVGKAGVVAIPLRLGPLQLPSAGEYTFTLEIVGMAEPIISTFQVLLNVPQAPMMPATAAVH